MQLIAVKMSYVVYSSTLSVKHTAAATPARAAVANVYCKAYVANIRPAASVMKPCMRAGAAPAPARWLYVTTGAA